MLPDNDRLVVQCLGEHRVEIHKDGLEITKIRRAATAMRRRSTSA
jgi:hypothetical protein